MFLALGMLSIFLFLSPFPWWMMSDHPNREIDEFFKLHESWPSRELRIVVNLLDSLKWDFSEDEVWTALIAAGPGIGSGWKIQKYWFKSSCFHHSAMYYIVARRKLWVNMKRIDPFYDYSRRYRRIVPRWVAFVVRCSPAALVSRARELCDGWADRRTAGTLNSVQHERASRTHPKHFSLEPS